MAKANLTAAEAELVLLREAVSRLETALAGACLRIEQMGSDLDDLDTRMGTVEAESRDTAATVAGLEEAAGDTERDVERAHERITSVGQDVDNLEDRVDGLEGRCDALATLAEQAQADRERMIGGAP